MDKIFPTQLVSEDGLRWINFFNGRLLTGDDLTQEQLVNRLAHQRLGQAVGAGIVNGLWVSADRLNDGSANGLVVTVDAGLAVNRDGQALWLKRAQKVSLLPPPAQASDTVQPRLFNACGEKIQDIPQQNGLYLLALTPSEGLEGRAQSSSLIGEGLVACNMKYLVEGVQFKLTQLSTIAYSDTLHNETAYACFTLDLSGTVLIEAPFGKQSGSPRNTDAMNALDADLPTYLAHSESCDVPLAVLYRDAQGIHFVDNWSVRRRVTASTTSSPWNVWVSDHQASEREAVFLQFQEQLASIAVNEASFLNTMTAKQRFLHLPPAGVLPANEDFWKIFLGTHAPIRETIVQADLLPGILIQALQHRPFEVIEPSQDPEAVITTVDVYKSDGSDFVVFTRSMQSRLQFYFNTEPTTFEIAMHLDHSNLEFYDFAKLYSRVTIQGANMPAGSYNCRYSLNDSTEIKSLPVDLVTGQITRKPLLITGFNLREGYWLDLPTLGKERVRRKDRQNDVFRLCLVDGAVKDAFIQRNDPDTEYILREMHRVTLDSEAKAKLASWQEALYRQLRMDAIRRLDPVLYADPLYRLPEGSSGIPEIPQAYLVFGTLLIPLTITSVPRGQEPIPLRAVFDNNGPGEFFKRHAPGTVSRTRLINDLESYGIVSADQLAGAWIMVLAKITRLPDRDYRQLIWHTVKTFQGNLK